MPDRSIARAIEIAAHLAVVDRQCALETLMSDTRTMANGTDNADTVR
jgi:hypothetical protein